MAPQDLINTEEEFAFLSCMQKGSLKTSKASLLNLNLNQPFKVLVTLSKMQLASWAISMSFFRDLHFQ